MLDHQTLLAALHYDPETGIWTRLQSCGRAHKGDRADKQAGHKYRRISFARKRYYSHILAWFYTTGAWPVADIDHKNTDAQNNKWENLREATRVQNAGNKKKQLGKTSNLKGVFWQSNANKWRAQIRRNGKSSHIGYFDSPEQAHEAYKIAAQEVFGEFARHD